MTYRDDVEAARIRRDLLRRELSEIDQKLAGAHALASRRAELARELERASRALDRARSKVALPLLARVTIASPCSARWEEMVGDDRVRHCRTCDKNVFDLSAMTRDEAEALLRAHGTGLCARFYRRADGTVMTSDCPVGARRVRMRNLELAGMTAAMVGTSLLSIAGGAAYLAASASEVTVFEDPPPMGAIAIAPEAPSDVGEPAQGGVSSAPPDEATGAGR